MDNLWVIFALISAVQAYTFDDPGPFETLSECAYTIVVNHKLMSEFIAREYYLDVNVEVPFYCVQKKDLDEYLRRRAYKLEQDQI